MKISGSSTTRQAIQLRNEQKTVTRQFAKDKNFQSATKTWKNVQQTHEKKYTPGNTNKNYIEVSSR